MSYPRQGEIWEADLNPTVGREQGDTRPVLIISVDQFNRTAAELVIVLPVTSKFKGFSTHVEVEPPEGGLKVKSYVMCEQPRTISQQRLEQSWGKLRFKTMQSVERIVKAILGF